MMLTTFFKRPLMQRRMTVHATEVAAVRARLHEVAGVPPHVNPLEGTDAAKAITRQECQKTRTANLELNPLLLEQVGNASNRPPNIYCSQIFKLSACKVRTGLVTDVDCTRCLVTVGSKTNYSCSLESRNHIEWERARGLACASCAQARCVSPHSLLFLMTSSPSISTSHAYLSEIRDEKFSNCVKACLSTFGEGAASSQFDTLFLQFLNKSITSNSGSECSRILRDSVAWYRIAPPLGDEDVVRSFVTKLLFAPFPPEKAKKERVVVKACYELFHSPLFDSSKAMEESSDVAKLVSRAKNHVIALRAGRSSLLCRPLCVDASASFCFPLSSMLFYPAFLPRMLCTCPLFCALNRYGRSLKGRREGHPPSHCWCQDRRCQEFEEEDSECCQWQRRRRMKPSLFCSSHFDFFDTTEYLMNSCKFEFYNKETGNEDAKKERGDGNEQTFGAGVHYERCSTATLKGGGDKDAAEPSGGELGPGLSNRPGANHGKYKCYVNAVLVALASNDKFMTQIKSEGESSLNNTGKLLRKALEAIQEHMNQKKKTEAVRTLMNDARDEVLKQVRGDEKEFLEGQHAGANDFLHKTIQKVGGGVTTLFEVQYEQRERCPSCKEEKSVTHRALQVGSKEALQTTTEVQQSRCWNKECKSKSRTKKVEYSPPPPVLVIDKTALVTQHLEHKGLRPEWPTRKFTTRCSNTESVYRLQSVLLFHGETPGAGHWTVILIDDNGRMFYYDDDSKSNGLLTGKRLRTVKSSGLPALEIYIRQEICTSTSTETKGSESKKEQSSGAINHAGADESREETIREETMADAHAPPATDKVEDIPMTVRRRKLPAHLRSYTLCVSMRDGSRIFSNRGEDSAPYNSCLIKQAFPSSIGDRVGVRSGRQEIRIEFSSLEHLHEAYNSCLKHSRSKVWDKNIDYYYLPASPDNGGLGNDEVPGRIIFEPISTQSEESAVATVTEWVRQSLAGMMETENLPLESLIEMPMLARRQQGRIAKYTVFVTARSFDLAKHIVHDLQGTKNIRISGNGCLSLCYRCKQRGHRDSNCTTPAVLVRREGGVINTVMKKEIQKITECSVMTNGKSMNENLPLRSFCLLYFDSDTKRKEACDKLRIGLEPGVLTTYTITEQPHSCCGLCGEAQSHLKSCPTLRVMPQHDGQNTQPLRSDVLYESLQRQIDIEEKGVSELERPILPTPVQKAEQQTTQNVHHIATDTATPVNRMNEETQATESTPAMHTRCTDGETPPAQQTPVIHQKAMRKRKKIHQDEKGAPGREMTHTGRSQNKKARTETQIDRTDSINKLLTKMTISTPPHTPNLSSNPPPDPRYTAPQVMSQVWTRREDANDTTLIDVAANP